MVFYKVEFCDGADLREWAVNSGWGLDYEIEKLDRLDLWQELFDVMDEIGEFDSETDLNDFIRFGLDDVGFFDDYEEEEEEQEVEEEEE